MGRENGQGIHPPAVTSPSRKSEQRSSAGQVLAKAGIRLKKRLGQHFISDRNLLRKIAEIMVPDPCYCVVEVGAGTGALTVELSRLARRVIAIEIDTRLRQVLDEAIRSSTNVQWIWGDVLQLDLQGIISGAGEREQASWVLCGNLPYYLTSQLLYKVLIPRTSFTRLAFLVQKEVADRMAALPGSRDFGRLSLWCGYRGDVKILRRIPRQVFSPPPQVDSCLVALNFRRSYPLDPLQELILDKLSRYAFAQRRKTIANTLRAMFDDKAALANLLREADIKPEERPEKVPVDAYVRLAGLISTFVSRTRPG